ncbi:methionine aminopeptidase type I [Roseivirga pacifica]|uniref:Methionine aminopeptidase n=1 Tax=Roseivirga pacifica TaxID=1267423 RepID=A0A1I0P147_9BACT|nr:type I methionyl aminopeptidase [Roseivirga pacifica]MCO6360115.1 type I methionyl aminopeptidase [Roseivirga pacifica]MCO6367486.1 type I methionyl aminopeptidase [Roseivirga pacifica]MCO6369983.1 type I methionyl aminopeptidase [Roseivirga pacifica]MCO6375142.1 type I methionyl aminopeptidase [Roseivirga pacifica]MCO6380401.1 type I methionyl aminopeptidase [Roseivirga pacifica]|tara:strand:+ start:267 stop:1040 length:774 start_codon:yes stop_codon:yes gene_type:complete
MIKYKTEEEIQKIRESALILGKTHGEVAKHVRPGIKTKELDKIAEEFIRDHGATGSFKGYGGFPATLCISTNEVVVHGFPSDYELKDGDIISIDCGVYYQGFHSDSAYTYPVGDVPQETLSLLKATKESLYVGIEEAKFGNRIGDLAFAIQKYVEDRGYTVVRELVGHGLGRDLHESPEVPNYGKRGRGPKLQEGLVIAIEPMVNLGTRNIVQERDGWTIRTKDRKPSAHFEHTVAIFKDRTEILTTHKYIEEVVNF